MAWKKCNIMDERMKFVSRLLDGERMSGLCREQLSRSSSSVVLNLAEGSGRSSKAEQRRFFQIAFGSLRESQAVMDLAGSNSQNAAECGDKVAAHLYRLIEYVDKQC